MKKITILIAATFIMISSYAQSPSGAEYVSNSNTTNVETANIPANYSVNIKAVRNLIDHYGDNNEASWYKTSNFYRAKFRQGQINFMADYDLKGRWIQTIKTYTEFQLPDALRKTVKQQYYDDHIFLVQEVNRPSGNHYLIRIENNKDWKILEWADDELTVEATFEK